jgi:hypothetical protein
LFRRRRDPQPPRHVLNRQSDLSRQRRQRRLTPGQRQRLTIQLQRSLQVMPLFQSPRRLQQGARLGCI